MEIKNESEKFFEQYLDSNGFQGKWEYEPTIEGKNKKPDYLLNWKGEKHFFEVKQIENESKDFLCSSVRGKIHGVRKQFIEYKEYCCSLVVFNCRGSQAVLEKGIIFEAMLGNLGISAVFNNEKGETVAGSERNVFLSEGKMINYKAEQPQNTTISAIVVLEEFFDNIEVEKAMKNEVKKHGREFEGPELIAVRMKLQENHHFGNVPRVVVIENPFARIPFPKDLFKGPFDERCRLIEDQSVKIVRVFVGNKLKELETLQTNA